MPDHRRHPSHIGAALISGLLAGASLASPSSPAIGAPAQSASQNSGGTEANGGKEPDNNGYDLTRPQNSIDLKFRYEDTTRAGTEIEREIAFLRLSSRIPLNENWKLAILGQIDALNKKTSSSMGSSSEEAGFGDSVFQAVLIQTLSDRWAYGFGARLVAPTAEGDLGSGKWLIMPGFGVRYSFLEWG